MIPEVIYLLERTSLLLWSRICIRCSSYVIRYVPLMHNIKAACQYPASIRCPDGAKPIR